MNRISIINSMCGTFDHSYGLMPKEQQEFLFRRMAQIYDNDIAPNMSIKIDKELKESFEKKLAILEESLDNVSPVHDYNSNGADKSTCPLCENYFYIRGPHKFPQSLSEFRHSENCPFKISKTIVDDFESLFDKKD